MKFLIGKKLGMTQRFRPDGTVVSVTEVRVQPAVVTQVKTADNDGYTAVQIGVPGSKRKLTKSVRGHVKGLGDRSNLHEFRLDDVSAFQRGQAYTVATFQPGDNLTVTGTSKGKGFAGVVKRHHFRGGPASHGHKDNLRAPGSIGSTAPQRVFKGLRMAGRMGGERTTVSGLVVVQVDPVANTLFVRGAIPGPRNGILFLSCDGSMPTPETPTASEPEAAVETKAEPVT